MLPNGVSRDLFQSDEGHDGGLGRIKNRIDPDTAATAKRVTATMPKAPLAGRLFVAAERKCLVTWLPTGPDEATKCSQAATSGAKPISIYFDL